MDPTAYAKLCSLLGYIDGDYGDPTTFVKLRKVLAAAKGPLYYLAVPPSLFAAVAEGLAKAGGAKDARVVVEKPFGRDLASARKLNSTLHRFFPEQAIFRIDHYLGKEPIHNLIYFRFANPLIEAGWDNRHIESVQITMAESFGVAGRGKLYEQEGAIRDVVQNHMLKVIACLAMECPAGKDHEARREERGRLLKIVRTLNASDVVRGQFRGYRREPGVAPDSQVETFAALRFHIDNERWKGVPLYVRVGKRLPVTVTEVLIRLKRPPRPVLDELDSPPANYYRFRISPEMVIALGTKRKKPGELMVGERIELIAHHQPPEEMEPYERLLGDAANGDATLFAGEDSVEAAWRVVESDPRGHDPTLGVRAQHLGAGANGADCDARRGLAQPQIRGGVRITRVAPVIFLLCSRRFRAWCSSISRTDRPSNASRHRLAPAHWRASASRRAEAEFLQGGSHKGR